MSKPRNQLLPLAIIGLACLNLIGVPGKAESTDMGQKGAEIYCFMRQTGNNHEVSWKAAYEVIKRQKSSLFKTSPKHGAVLIVESVVSNPGNYENCGNYLGDLFTPPQTTSLEEVRPSKSEFKPSAENNMDRYEY